MRAVHLTVHLAAHLALGALLLAPLATGCDFAALEASSDDGEGGASPDVAQCVGSRECALVASSCCGCPTFAAPIGFGGGCDEIDCPTEPACAPAEAVCDVGQCALVCSPVVTTAVCESGFMVDEAGCTLDICDAGIASECAVADDCTVAPADCCGCAEGGNDTAVATGALEAHLESLDCSGPVSCPGVSSCEPEGRAACLGGRCRYLRGDETDGSAALCGTAETGACAAGEVCVLNAEPSTAGATIPGIGVCLPQ